MKRVGRIVGGIGYGLGTLLNGVGLIVTVVWAGAFIGLSIFFIVKAIVG